MLQPGDLWLCHVTDDSSIVQLPRALQPASTLSVDMRSGVWHKYMLKIKRVFQKYRFRRLDTMRIE